MVAGASGAVGLSEARCAKKNAGVLYTGGRPHQVIWHERLGLFSCRREVVHGSRRPVTRRLGPWPGGAHGAYDVFTRRVAWSVPYRDFYGARYDRLWLRYAWGSRPPVFGSLKATPLAVGAEVLGESTIVKLVADLGHVVWITGDGAIFAENGGGMQLEPAEGVSGAQLIRTTDIVRLGSYPDANVSQLAKSLRLREGPAVRDECGGTADMTISFTEPGTGVTLTFRGAHDVGGLC